MRFLVVTCFVLLSAGSAAAQSPEKPKLPNVVFIVSDDHGSDDYGFLGHPLVKTPNLDRLAKESLVFPKGYVTSSLCCPSLASILTGQYPHQNKITSNDPPGKANAANGREWYSKQMSGLTTLTRLLRQLRYLSLQTGKWWHGEFSTGGFTHGMTEKGRHGDEGLAIGRKTMKPVYDFIDEAVSKKQPFFIWYAPMLPHTPHDPPERHLAQYRDKVKSPAIAKYLGCVSWFDETCGQLLDHLDQRKLTNDTIVVYVADNGWHQEPETGKLARSKRTQYDLGHRTPIMIRWPGRVEPGTSKARVSSIDLAPTILKAVKLPIPDEMTGVDLLDSKAVASRKHIFGETFTHNAVDLDDPASSLNFRWVIEGPWRLIVPSGRNEGTGPVALYNIDADPEEKTNLAEQHPDRVAQLRGALDAWWPGR